MRISDWSSDVCSSDLTLSDKNAQFQFVVQALAGAEVRRTVFLCWACLTDGTGKLLARYAYAGGPSVIADRYPFIVGQQRVVGTKLLAYRCGMMQRNIEVGVVADVGGQAHLDVGYITQHRFDNALQGRAAAQGAR